VYEQTSHYSHNGNRLCYSVYVRVHVGSNYEDYCFQEYERQQSGRHVGFQVLTTLVAKIYYILGCNAVYPEDGGKMLLRNVCWLSTVYTALYPRR
jgi:hypothetical protein